MTVTYFYKKDENPRYFHFEKIRKIATGQYLQLTCTELGRNVGHGREGVDEGVFTSGKAESSGPEATLLLSLLALNVRVTKIT